MYADIVFLQGDEAAPIVDQLFQVNECVAHGISAESFEQVLSYLRNWDYGDEPAEYRDHLGAGTGDVVIYDDDGVHVLVANLKLNHISLYRIGT
jgi:hypothetical protein